MNVNFSLPGSSPVSRSIRVGVTTITLKAGDVTTFGDLLRSLRVEKGWDQGKLGSSIGLRVKKPGASISHWEGGKIKYIDAQKLRALEEVFSLETGVLFAQAEFCGLRFTLPKGFSLPKAVETKIDVSKSVGHWQAFDPHPTRQTPIREITTEAARPNGTPTVTENRQYISGDVFLSEIGDGRWNLRSGDLDVELEDFEVARLAAIFEVVGKRL